MLLHKKEILKLMGSKQIGGYTIVATALYWKKNNAKLEIALAKGKQLHDKRDAEIDRDWKRAQQRIHFLKNLTIFGGLLIAAGDTAGHPSLAWRGRHAVKSARHDITLAGQSARAQAKTVKAAAKAAQASARAGAKTGAAASRAKSLLPS